MSNPKYTSREKLVYFSLSGTIEMGPRNVELCPRDYRAHYDEFDDGAVCITQIDRKKGDKWVRDKLLDELDEALTDAIEADIAAEQQEIVDSYDAHAWRYGS